MSDNESSFSFSSNSQSEELNSHGKRRSVRRVSSSSTNTSSKTANTKEPLYTRRRVGQSDNHVNQLDSTKKKSYSIRFLEFFSTNDTLNRE